MTRQPATIGSRGVEHRAELAMQVLRDSREMPDGCILYRGPTDASGFGRMRYDGRVYSPHQVILEQVLGRALGRGERPKQTCGRRTCVSPEHVVLERRTTERGPQQRVRRKPRIPASLAELLGQLDLMLHKLRVASRLAKPKSRVRKPAEQVAVKPEVPKPRTRKAADAQKPKEPAKKKKLGRARSASSSARLAIVEDLTSWGSMVMARGGGKTSVLAWLISDGLLGCIAPQHLSRRLAC